MLRECLGVPELAHRGWVMDQVPGPGRTVKGGTAREQGVSEETSPHLPHEDLSPQASCLPLQPSRRSPNHRHIYHRVTEWGDKVLELSSLHNSEWGFEGRQVVGSSETNRGSEDVMGG